MANPIESDTSPRNEPGHWVEVPAWAFQDYVNRLVGQRPKTAKGEK